MGLARPEEPHRYHFRPSIVCQDTTLSSSAGVAQPPAGAMQLPCSLSMFYCVRLSIFPGLLD